MSLTEKLTEIKSQTDALLAYANSQTGKDDPDLGEAIRSLVDSMGSGIDIDLGIDSGYMSDLFRAIENGSYIKREVVFETPITGEGEVVDFGTDIDGFICLCEEYDSDKDSSEGTLVSYCLFDENGSLVTNPSSGTYYNSGFFITKTNAVRHQNSSNYNGFNRTSLTRLENGKVYVTQQYSGHGNWKPFFINHKYTFIGWNNDVDIPSTPTVPDADWELVATESRIINLSRDTSFDTTPSTTGGVTVLASIADYVDITFDDPIDLYEYDYCHVCMVESDIVYKTDPKPRQIESKGCAITTIYTAETNTNNRMYSIQNASTMYKNKTISDKGAISYVQALTFGVNKYPCTNAKYKASDTLDGTEYTSTTVSRRYLKGVSFPSGGVSSRYNTTYTLESINDIDSNNTNYVDTVRIYKRKRANNDIIGNALTDIWKDNK